MVCTTHLWENFGMVDPISLLTEGKAGVMGNPGLQAAVLPQRGCCKRVFPGREVERVQVVGRNE